MSADFASLQKLVGLLKKMVQGRREGSFATLFAVTDPPLLR